ncbi:hypothetical protein [Rathayibacter sp. SD072]|uniref:hypothetical protein n=1 Tax=Rathayibacter sp. SD072 TaxID=2781731 RepID=UPI001A972732|nr:hypothetical protein [Rathayibacter sp. SD072]MBO0985033.1 hypothetical protein [Rathayibacter sp. SD072]
MPDPSPIPIPDEVKVAIRVIGDEINHRILWFLLHLDQPERGSYFGPIRKQVPEKTAETVRRHLVQLEDAGAVIVDTPVADRPGRTVLYRADKAFIKELFAKSEANMFSDAPRPEVGL